MDPSIMKLLEEDEDETMHSGADVEALTAALNRDIEGDTSISQPSDSDGALSQGSNHTSSQLFPQWQTSSHEENASCQSEEVKGSQQQEQHSSVMELKQHGSGSENQQPHNDIPKEMNRLPLQQKRSQDGFQQQQAERTNLHMSQTLSMQNTDNNPGLLQETDRKQNPDSASQHQRLQRMSNQQAVATGQAVNTMNRGGKQVPFALLLPVIEPQLDKDRAMQLHALYNELKQDKMRKEEFVRRMRNLVGDHMLKLAVYKMQGQAARNSQNASNQFPLPAKTSAQHLQMPSTNSRHIPSPAAQLSADSSNLAMDNDAQTSQVVEHQSDSQGTQVSQTSSSNLSAVNQERDHPFPIQGLSKQQQQHLHFSQQPHDLQMRQIPVHPNIGTTQLGSTTQALNPTSVPKFERQNSVSDLKRVQSGTLSHLTNNSTLQQNSDHWQSSIYKEQKQLSSMTYVKQEPIDQANELQQKSQLSTQRGLTSFPPGQLEQGNAILGASKDESFEMQSSRIGLSTSMATPNSERRSITSQLERHNLLSSRISSPTSPLGPNAKTPPKKPSIGLKKPMEAALVSSLPLSSKKQKVPGAFSDQSIEQLNDVTAVSGVNLREEEEQLFSGSKEDSRVSEASRRVVQEEEERLILQKIPLQKKLSEIMAKCGVKGRSNDVERCLSLCVEERMRGLLNNLIRLSKQRVDLEKPRHRTVITSDVRQQIMVMNRKSREEWEKIQADAEKLQRMDEPEGNTGVDGDKEKDEGRGKSSKANKEDDDKMRTTAANVAARAAVGGDDVLSKWQLMAEQARQKREGGVDAASASQPSIDVGLEPVSTYERNATENHEAEKRSPSAAIAMPGAVRRFGRNQDVSSQNEVRRSISIKDVVSVLEREPQMAKSTLIYRLYEKIRSEDE